MIKKIIFGLLIFAFIVEAALTFLAFFKTAFAMDLFGVVYNTETSFLAFIIAWFLLLVTIIIGYAIYLLKTNNPTFTIISYNLGFWWVALGIGVYMAFGKADNLFLDSIKGVLLIGATYFHTKNSKTSLKL